MYLSRWGRLVTNSRQIGGSSAELPFGVLDSRLAIVQSVRVSTAGDRYPCPCCGHLVFTGEPGSYEICPVCWWEDDPAQRKDPELTGGANEKSLREARELFAECGASDVRFVDRVRKTRGEEGGKSA